MVRRFPLRTTPLRSKVLIGPVKSQRLLPAPPPPPNRISGEFTVPIQLLAIVSIP